MLNVNFEYSGMIFDHEHICMKMSETIEKLKIILLLINFFVL